MTDTTDINTVDEGDDYYHVEFRDEDKFDTIRMSQSTVTPSFDGAHNHMFK